MDGNLLIASCPCLYRSLALRRVVFSCAFNERAGGEGEIAGWQGPHRGASRASLSVLYMREKFGNVYPESIGHAENDDGFDLFQPYGIIENPPFEIPEWTNRSASGTRG